MLKSAMDEIAVLSGRMGVTLPPDSTDRALAFVDALPADATSSMMRDFRDGKRTELDTLCGAVVRMAEQVGVEVPVHAFLYAALLPQELIARGES
jgi:2-dehydropantoate 2-reductase